MGLFDLFKKKKPELKKDPMKPLEKSTGQEPVKESSKVDFTREITEEEKELVAVIASSIAAGSEPDAKFKIKSIQGIDTDKEIAAAIVSAVLAGDRPDSAFRLVSITEVK